MLIGGGFVSTLVLLICRYVCAYCHHGHPKYLTLLAIHGRARCHRRARVLRCLGFFTSFMTMIAIRSIFSVMTMTRRSFQHRLIARAIELGKLFHKCNNRPDRVIIVSRTPRRHTGHLVVD